MVLLTTWSENGGEHLVRGVIHRLRPGVREVHLQTLLEATGQVGDQTVVVGRRVELVGSDLARETSGPPGRHKVRECLDCSEIRGTRAGCLKDSGTGKGGKDIGGSDPLLDVDLILRREMNAAVADVTNLSRIVCPDGSLNGESVVLGVWRDLVGKIG